MFLPHPRVKVSIVGSLRDREVACSDSDRQGSNFEYCVWRTVSSQSSHQPQEVLLAQFSLYVHKGGLKPDSFHFYYHHLFGLRVLRNERLEHTRGQQGEHEVSKVSNVRLEIIIPTQWTSFKLALFDFNILTPYNAKIFFVETIETRGLFSIWNHQIGLSQLFLIYFILWFWRIKSVPALEGLLGFFTK